MRLDHLLLRKGKISNVYFALRVLLAKLGKLDEVQRKSVISFSGMSKDISELFFEITKEGRKLMRDIFRRINEKNALSEGWYLCLVRKRYTRTSRGLV